MRKKSFPFWLIAGAFLSGCLPGTDFDVAVKVLDEETGRPIPDAWVFVTARVQTDPPFDPPYDKPLAGAMAKTGSNGVARLGKLEGLNRNEPTDVLFRAIEGAREARKGNPKRRISGIEGGNIVVLARGYGAVARTFGIKDNPAYQEERRKERPYEGVGRMGFKEPGEPIELSLAEARKGAGLTFKLPQPEPQYVAASYCPMVLAPMIWGPTSWKAGASQRDKKAVYEFILKGVADLGAKAWEECGHGRAAEWADPEFKKDFITHDAGEENNHDTSVHLWLTQKALEILPPGYDEVKRYAESIKEGVIAEDKGLRPLNHFYNPYDPENAMTGGEQALKWAAIGHPDNPKNEWDWQDALRYYREGDKTKSYKALGHVLHILEDLSTPMHTHAIAHHYAAQRGAARFELYFSRLAKDQNGMLPPIYALGARSPKNMGSLQGRFDGLARLTFGAHLSDRQLVDFGAFYKWEKGKLGEQVKEPDEYALNLMGRHLFPAAIEYSAELLKGYYDQFNPPVYVQASQEKSASTQDGSGARAGIEADPARKQLWLDAKPGTRGDWAGSICTNSQGRLAAFLITRLAIEESENDRGAIVTTLADCGEKNVAIESLLVATKDVSPRVRHLTARSLMRRGEEKLAIPALIGLMRSGHSPNAVGRSFHMIRDSMARSEAASQLRTLSLDPGVLISNKAYFTLIAAHLDPRRLDIGAEEILLEYLEQIGTQPDISQTDADQILVGLLNIAKKNFKHGDLVARIRRITQQAAKSRIQPIAERARKNLDVLEKLGSAK